MIRTIVAVAAGAMITLGITSCSSNPIAGAPTPESTTADGSFGTTYNPCTALTNEQIASFGLDPGSKTSDVGLPADFGRGCDWHRADFGVSFVVGRQDVNHFKSSSYLDIHPLQIAGRDAVSFRLDQKGGCTVAIATGKTALTIDLVQSVTDRQAGKDPCPPVLAIAEQVAPTLPQ